MTKRRLALALALSGLIAALALPTGLLALATHGSSGTPRAVAAESPKALASLLEDLGQINRTIDRALDKARGGDFDGAEAILGNYFSGVAGSGLHGDMEGAIRKLGPEFFATYLLGRMDVYLVEAGQSWNGQRVEIAQKQKHRAEKALQEELMKARCTVNGTQADDVLKGTNGTNVLCGQGGGDKIDGRAAPTSSRAAAARTR